MCRAIVSTASKGTTLLAALAFVCASAGSQTTSQVIVTLAGNGTGGYSGDGGAATLASLSDPRGVAIDTSGNVYIADTANYVIRRVTPDGTIATIVGNGTAKASGDGGPAINASLINPKAVAVDSRGNLFIADGDAIREVDKGTGIIHTLSSTLPPGSGCTGTCIVPTLKGGVALAVDASDNLYIADSVDNIVERLTPQGYLAIIAGNGTAGYSGDGGEGRDAQLNSPQGVVVSSLGEVFIADTGNHVIRRVFSNFNGAINTYAGSGTSGTSGDGGTARKAQFISPVGLAMDASGNLYISDQANHVIREVLEWGAVTAVAGTGTAGFSGDGGPALAAELNGPTALAMDRSRNLYVADSSNQRIRKLGAAEVTATPTFDLAPGTYNVPQSVGISDTTAGATIYYTIDGTTPTVSSTVYTGAIAVTATEKIEAIAVAAGFAQSAVVSAAYSIGHPLIGTIAGDAFAGYSGDGGPATSAELRAPEGIAVDKSGNFYFADSTTHVIRKVTPDGIINTIAGNGEAGYSGDGGPAASAQLNTPEGLTVDDFDNLYIADRENFVVRKIDVNGIISTVAGNGTQGISGDGGPATSAQLFTVQAVAVDKSGNLYIADTNSNRVRQVTLGGVIDTVAGNGLSGYTGDGDAAVSAELNQPSAVAIDASGNLYIADYANNVIRKVTPDGIINTVVGTKSAGYSGDGGLATSAQLNGPNGIAFDASGNLYILDYGNLVIRKVTPEGIISTVAGNGIRGYVGDGDLATNAEINYADGIAVDNFYNLYISDTGNFVVRRVGSVTTTPVAATPVFDLASGNYSGNQTVNITDTTPGATIYYTIDGSTPTTASSVYSGSITVSTTETIKAIAVASGYYRSIVAAATYTFGAPTTPVITWTNPGAIVYGTPLNSTQLNATASVPGTFVYALVEDPNTPAMGAVLSLGGHMLSVNFTPDDSIRYTTAYATVEIYVVPAGGPNITTVFGNGTQGYAGDGGPAASAELNIPFSVATDGYGNVYIGDANNFLIRKVTPDGTISTIAGIPGRRGYSGDGGPATSAKISDPFAMAIDAAGNLFFTDVDNNVVRKIASNGIISTVAGTGNYGNSGDGGPATSALFYSPIGLALDAAGDLFIADSHNNVIRKVTPDGIISRFAGSYTQGYSGDGGPATSAALYMPWGITVDASGSLYICDYYNHVIRKVAADGTISTVAGYGVNGIGALGYSGDGGPATSAELMYPSGVATDNLGNLYIADPQIFVIRKVAADGTISTVAGNATQGYSGDGGQANLAQLNLPQGVATDITGNLYIADSFNNVIRKVSQGTAMTLPAPVFSPAAGTYTSTQTVSIVTSVSTGAAIYYTTDGSTPTTSSTLYTGPITVSATETINAIAVATGYLQSPVATAAYIVNITKLSQTIRFETYPVSARYGDSPTTLVATASSGLPVSFNVSGPAKIDGSTLTITGAGDVQIFAYQLGNDTYAPAHYVQRNITVRKASLTITANDKTIAYPAPLPTFDYMIAGFVNGDTSSSLQGAPVASTTAPQNPVGGTYSISFTQGSLLSSNYSFTFVDGTLTVTGGAAQTIKFDTYPVLARYGDGPTTLVATASSGLPVSFNVSGPAKIDGSTLTITGAGDVQVFAYQLGNDAYAPAHYVQRSIAVRKASLTVTANDKTIAYPAPLPTFDYTIAGFVNGDTSSSLQGTPVASTTAPQNPVGGTYSISFTQGSLLSSNYSFTFVDGTLTVTGGAAQTIRFDTYPVLARYGDGPTTLVATASSGLPVSFSVSGPATIDGSTLTITGAGQVAIIATQLGNNDYAPAHFVQRTIAVQKAGLVITANNKTINYGQPLPALDYTVSGFVNGESASVLGGVPVVSTTAAPNPSGGTYPISLSQGSLSSSNYSYTLVDGTLTVLQAPTICTLTASNASTTPGQSVTLTAQIASSAAGALGGTVTFFDGAIPLSTVPLSGGSANYSTSSLLGGVTHVLTATYSGDTNFAASSSASSISVDVAPLDFTLTFTGTTRGTVKPGGVFVYEIVVNPIYGSYAGPVNVTVKGLPPGATATFSPTTLAANAGTQTITVTIQTLAATAMQRTPQFNREKMSLAFALLLLPLIRVSKMRRYGHKLSGLLSLLLILVGIAAGTALTGCGVSNGFLAQPPQIYSLDITVTAGNVEHTATITLEVQ